MMASVAREEKKKRPDSDVKSTFSTLITTIDPREIISFEKSCSTPEKLFGGGGIVFLRSGISTFIQLTTSLERSMKIVFKSTFRLN